MRHPDIRQDLADSDPSLWRKFSDALKDSTIYRRVGAIGVAAATVIVLHPSPVETESVAPADTSVTTTATPETTTTVTPVTTATSEAPPTVYLTPDGELDFTAPSDTEVPPVPEQSEVSVELPDPVSITIPAIDVKTSFGYSGSAYGGTNGLWGSVGAFGEFNLHRFGDRLHRPGEHGVAFIGAHSNKNRSGEADMGFNLIDDAEYKDDAALKPGDIVRITLADGRIAVFDVFDLGDYFPEDESTGIRHLPDDQGSGIYVYKYDLWEKAYLTLTDPKNYPDFDSVAILFTSYGGPSGKERLPDQPEHRAYYGAIGCGLIGIINEVPGPN